MLRYSFLTPAAATHSTDLVPTFMNDALEAYNILRFANVSRSEAATQAVLLDGGIRHWYQQWLAAFGATGNPNTNNGVQFWPRAVGGEQVSNVMEVFDTNSTHVIADDQSTKSSCEFHGWHTPNDSRRC